MNIRATREKLKLTQVELAEHLGVAGNTVARWERGELIPESVKLVELALFGLEIKLRDVKTREKIRKLEAEARMYVRKTDEILKRMNIE